MATYRKDSKTILELIENGSEQDLQIMPIYGLTVSEKMKALEKLQRLRPDLNEILERQIVDLKKLYMDDEKWKYRVIEPA